MGGLLKCGKLALPGGQFLSNPTRRSEGGRTQAPLFLRMPYSQDGNRMCFREIWSSAVACLTPGCAPGKGSKGKGIHHKS